MQTTSKKIDILNLAQEAIQKRGYNAFSYADLASAVGIRKASIHHYFPTKADLGLAVIRRYRESFEFFLNAIDSSEKNALVKIERYAKLYEDVLLDGKLCLCGMLATDIETLPKPLQKEIRKFFTDNINWLVHVLQPHFATKKMTDKRLHETASMIIATLQGATNIAKAFDDVAYFNMAVKALLSHLEKMK
jgi:TetR/AcrR family transcriptional repressor of nem operon